MHNYILEVMIGKIRESILQRNQVVLRWYKSTILGFKDGGLKRAGPGGMVLGLMGGVDGCVVTLDLPRLVT